MGSSKEQKVPWLLGEMSQHVNEPLHEKQRLSRDHNILEMQKLLFDRLKIDDEGLVLQHG
jgi:hypothetical protein